MWHPVITTHRLDILFFCMYDCRFSPADCKVTWSRSVTFIVNMLLDDWNVSVLNRLLSASWDYWADWGTKCTTYFSLSNTLSPVKLASCSRLLQNSILTCWDVLARYEPESCRQLLQLQLQRSSAAEQRKKSAAVRRRTFESTCGQVRSVQHVRKVGEGHLATLHNLVQRMDSQQCFLFDRVESKKRTTVCKSRL